MSPYTFQDEGEDDDNEELEEWEGCGKEDLAEAMIGMLEVDDPSDLDWLPERLKNKRNKGKQEKKCKGIHIVSASR